MTEVRNDIFKEGDLVANFRAKGLKVPRVLISIDKLMPQLTPEEIEKLLRWMILDELVHHDPDPETRRRLLSKFDTCPCCQNWLGHNRPPADDGDPQSSFGFER
jgi:hypothetical protein